MLSVFSVVLSRYMWLVIPPLIMCQFSDRDTQPEHSSVWCLHSGTRVHSKWPHWYCHCPKSDRVSLWCLYVLRIIRCNGTGMSWSSLIYVSNIELYIIWLECMIHHHLYTQSDTISFQCMLSLLDLNCKSFFQYWKIYVQVKDFPHTYTAVVQHATFIWTQNEHKRLATLYHATYCATPLPHYFWFLGKPLMYYHFTFGSASWLLEVQFKHGPASIMWTHSVYQIGHLLHFNEEAVKSYSVQPYICRRRWW